MMKERNKEIRRGDSGFTMIEIILVVVIIGILAAIAVPRLGQNMEKAMKNAAKQGIAVIEGAVDVYEVDNGKLPDSLQSLMTKGGEPNWNGPYLKKAEGLKDPWGTEFQYTKQGNLYTIVSAGPDMSPGSPDDIK
jgi:general secretion pathway protein G